MFPIQVTKIVCPHCSEELRGIIIKMLIPPELYEKYEKFLQNAQVTANPLLKWCPNPKCSKIVVLQKENAEIAQCKLCGQKICGKCGQEYHSTSVTCEQVI